MKTCTRKKGSVTIELIRHSIVALGKSPSHQSNLFLWLIIPRSWDVRAAAAAVAEDDENEMKAARRTRIRSCLKYDLHCRDVTKTREATDWKSRRSFTNRHEYRMKVIQWSIEALRDSCFQMVRTEAYYVSRVFAHRQSLFQLSLACLLIIITFKENDDWHTTILCLIL